MIRACVDQKLHDAGLTFSFGAVELMKSTALTFLNRERKTAQTDWSGKPCVCWA